MHKVDPDLLAQYLDPERFPAFYQALLTQGKTRRYATGSALHRQGEQLKRIGIMLEGSTEAEFTTIDGNRLIAERLHAGIQLGGANFIDGQGAPCDMVALEPCLEIYLPYSTIRASEQLTHEVNLQIAVYMTSLFRTTAHLFTSSNLQPLRERILRRLHTLKDNDNRVEITAEKLAAYLSVSKYKVHRVLNEMEQEGLLKNSYGVVVLQPGSEAS